MTFNLLVLFFLPRLWGLMYIEGGGGSEGSCPLYIVSLSTTGGFRESPKSLFSKYWLTLTLKYTVHFSALFLFVFFLLSKNRTEVDQVKQSLQLVVFSTVNFVTFINFFGPFLQHC